MVATHSGASGLAVPWHAQEELSDAHVHAPVLLLHTEEEGVGDLDHIENPGNVTRTIAQVNIFALLIFVCEYCVLIEISNLSQYWV